MKVDLVLISFDDGFEVVLVIYDCSVNILIFVGVGILLFIQFFDGIKCIVVDRYWFGYCSLCCLNVFKVYMFIVEVDEIFYIVIDGVIDYIGGKNKCVFGCKRLFEVLEVNVFVDLEM